MKQSEVLSGRGVAKVCFGHAGLRNSFAECYTAAVLIQNSTRRWVIRESRVWRRAGRSQMDKISTDWGRAGIYMDGKDEQDSAGKN